MKSFEHITNEEIEYYYNETNHSQYECALHFEMSVGLFIKLLKQRGIRKDTAKHSERIKLSKKERYGNENYNNREQAKDTCLEKYGVDNPFKDVERVRDGMMKKFGCDHPMHNASIKQRVVSKKDYKKSTDKARSTYFKKTGYSNPSKNPSCIDKMLKTKVKNGCYDHPGTSNLEKRLEKLLKRKFGEVIPKYRDTRYERETGYMYECDFYVPSEDLFVELNAHPTHYICPYDKSNKTHIALAEQYRQSFRKWDKVTYETWAVRDSEKRECALRNSLNYIVLYPSNTIFNNKSFNDKKYSKLIEYLLKKLK